jgi:hypothetical protein
MEGTMKHVHAIVAAGGFALALATAMATDVNRADAESGMASNSQLKGKYAGINSGACLVALSGFNQNDQPIDPTTSFSNVFSADVVFTFDGYGRGNANFTTYTELRLPGTNARFVPLQSVSTAGGNFTYSVGPKHTVTVTLTDLTFKILTGISAGVTVVIDHIALDGHLGTNGLTLVKTDGAVEILTPSAGSPVHRICERSFVLLSDRERL